MLRPRFFFASEFAVRFPLKSPGSVVRCQAFPALLFVPSPAADGLLTSWRRTFSSQSPPVHASFVFFSCETRFFPLFSPQSPAPCRFRSKVFPLVSASEHFQSQFAFLPQQIFPLPATLNGFIGLPPDTGVSGFWQGTSELLAYGWAQANHSCGRTVSP